MQSFNRFLKYIVAFSVIGGAALFVIVNYSWVFAKKVRGEILGVERVTDPTAIIGGRLTDSQIHSYAVLIQGQDGKLYTSSSDDRQWQVAKKGYCVEALLYRYPPWDFGKANTFFNARLMEISICPGKAVPTDAATPETLPPPPPPSAPPSQGSK